MLESVAHNRIAVIGTGFSGIAAAVRLTEAGETDFVLYERSGDVGGTWRDNTYPGCACDVPSHLYSFSFAPNPSWSRAFSPQPAIQRYLRGVADSYGVTPRVRFHHEIEDASWDEADRVWRLNTSKGERTADILVSAVGGLSAPSIPQIKGLEDFEGPAFHSAEWDHEAELDGKRVAVIGTGASAIQFVPELQPRAASIDLFQRTPPWIMPRRDRPISKIERRLFRTFPALQKAVRTAIYWGRELFALPMLKPRIAGRTELIARKHLEHQVPDPRLRAKLTPDYSIGCKRILLSNQYYRSLGEENVEVVTTGIREIRRDSVVTVDGVEHPADAIVFGTGFKVADMPVGHQIHGRGGVSLHETWAGSPTAHLGVTVGGFPNFFMLMGPNTGLGHTSVTIMIEAQVDYLVDALSHLRRQETSVMEPTPAAIRGWRSEIDRLSEGTVWTAGGCNSWYLDDNGKNSILWPSFATSYRHRLSTFRPDEFEFGPGRKARVAVDTSVSA